MVAGSSHLEQVGLLGHNNYCIYIPATLQSLVLFMWSLQLSFNIAASSSCFIIENLFRLFLDIPMIVLLFHEHFKCILTCFRIYSRLSWYVSQLIKILKTRNKAYRTKINRLFLRFVKLQQIYHVYYGNKMTLFCICKQCNTS